MKTTRSVPFAIAAAAAWALWFVVCAAAAPAAEQLGPGDTVRITVFQSPDLTTEARISEAGTLAFPLLGEIAVADLAPLEAGQLIAKRLRDGRFVHDPQVNVTLLELRSRQVSVLGEVARPGPYPLEEAQETLTELLARAGGVTANGDDNVIVITRRNGGSERLVVDVPAMYRSGDLSKDVELVHGDTIFVPAAPLFYIYGAAQRPGAYRLEPQTSVLRALTLGGGLAPRGTERGLTIHRRMPDGSAKEIEAKLTDLVEPNDIIRVRESVF
jgi:polysaccharide export outer membrane protein